jgi:hypothetical protein
VKEAIHGRSKEIYDEDLTSSTPVSNKTANTIAIYLNFFIESPYQNRAAMANVNNNENA